MLEQCALHDRTIHLTCPACGHGRVLDQRSIGRSSVAQRATPTSIRKLPSGSGLASNSIVKATMAALVGLGHPLVAFCRDLAGNDFRSSERGRRAERRLTLASSGNSGLPVDTPEAGKGVSRISRHRIDRQGEAL